MANSTTGSFSGNFRNLNELYRSFLDAQTLSSYLANSSMSADKSAKPLVNYSNFKEHIFFDKAIRKLESAFNKIFNNYPIGISATPVASLTGKDVAAVNLFLNDCTDFEKYVVNYLGGAISEVTNQKPTVTAAAIVNGVTNPLIVIYRNLNNSISGSQATLTSNLYNMALNFDNGFNAIQNISLTADHDIAYINNDEEIISRILPSAVSERISRSHDFTELIPDAYFYNDIDNNLERYLAVMGRTFDEIKLYIDELVNLNTISWDKYHRTPEGLFQTLLAKQYGVDIISNTLNEQINSYLRSVNNKLPSYKVANVIFNRILNNLIFLLKRKGTKEALQSIIRIFGLPTDYITLNNYEYYGEEQVRNKVDFVNTRVLDSNTTSGKIIFDPPLSSYFAFPGDFTIEARVTLTGAYNQPNSGIIFWYGNSTSGYHLAYKDGQFFFRVNDITVKTSTADATTVANAMQSGWVNVFGERYQNLATVYASWIDTTVTTGTLNTVQSSGADYVDTVILSGVTSCLSGFMLGSSGGASAFIGFLQEVKGFTVPLSDTDRYEHTKNFESVSVTNTSSGSASSLRFCFKLKENKTIIDPYNYIIDSSGNSVTGHFNSSLSGFNPYALYELERKETEYSTFGGFVDDNMEFTINDPTTNSKVVNKGVIVMSFAPIEAVNRDIENVLGNFNLGNLIADPRNFLSSASGYDYYPAMIATADNVFRRYNNSRLNFNSYIKAIDEFSPVVQALIQIADQFIPARSKLVSKGTFIESHILERNRNKQSNLNYISEDDATTATAKQLQQFYEDETLDSLFDLINDPISSQYWDDPVRECLVRALNNPLTSIDNINNAIGLNSIDMIFDSSSYFAFTGDTSIYISSSGFGNSKNVVYKLSQNNFILPYIQEIANPKDVAILFTTNRNVIENSFSLSAQEDRLTITGNAKLIRTNTGKVITSQNNTFRLEFPNDNGFNLISLTANGTTLNGLYSEHILNSKAGIDFKITSNEWDTSRGIQNLRIVNLISGNSQEFPLIILATTADAANLAGGQLVIKVGKAVV